MTTFQKLQHGFLRDGRVATLSDSQVVTLLAVRDYVSQELTDGFLPETAHRFLARPNLNADLTALVAAHLLVPQPGGHLVVDWRAWARSRAEVDAHRENNRARQRDFQERRRTSVTPSVTPLVTGLATPLLTQPDTDTEIDADADMSAPRCLGDRYECPRGQLDTHGPCLTCQRAKQLNAEIDAKHREQLRNAPACPNPDHPGMRQPCSSCAADQKAARL